MASPVVVKVEGLRQKVRDLEAMGVEVDDLKGAFGAIAKEAAVVTRGFIPTLTGTLAGTARGNRAKSKAVVTVGRASVPYAGAINYGWPARNIEPAGFFEKTDKAMEPVAEKRIEQELDKLITKKGLT